MAYDSPNALTRREQSFLTVAGNGTVSCRMVNYQKTKLVAAHVTVVTAGTSATTGNSLIIKNGTTALATATLGTSTAGYQVSLDLGDATANSLALVTATNGTDATGVSAVTYEYDVWHDASQSS